MKFHSFFLLFIRVFFISFDISLLSIFLDSLCTFFSPVCIVGHSHGRYEKREIKQKCISNFNLSKFKRNKKRERGCWELWAPMRESAAKHTGGTRRAHPVMVTRVSACYLRARKRLSRPRYWSSAGNENVDQPAGGGVAMNEARQFTRSQTFYQS